MIQQSEQPDILKSALMAGVAGFSVGGPIGAAVGGVAGLATSLYKNSVNDPVKVYRSLNSISNAGIDQGIVQSAPAAKRNVTAYSYEKVNPKLKTAETMSNIIDVGSTAINSFSSFENGSIMGNDTGSGLMFPDASMKTQVDLNRLRSDLIFKGYDTNPLLRNRKIEFKSKLF